MEEEYSHGELREIGFVSLGQNICIHRTVLFWGPEHIHLGSNLRVDAYCVITAGPGDVVIGNYVHIAVGCSIFGGAALSWRIFADCRGGLTFIP